MYATMCKWKKTMYVETAPFFRPVLFPNLIWTRGFFSSIINEGTGNV